MNEEVGICVLTQMALLKLLGTLYNEVLLLVSRLLLLSLLGTLYLVLCTMK
jgi:hypothetical protein